MTHTPNPADRKPIDCAAHAAAWSLLSRIRRPVEAVHEEAADARHRVVVEIGPAADVTGAHLKRQVGLWLSPLEALIVERIAEAKRASPGHAILGKNVAALIGREYSPSLKVVVRNLVDREILLHDDADGYSVR